MAARRGVLQTERLYDEEVTIRTTLLPGPEPLSRVSAVGLLELSQRERFSVDGVEANYRLLNAQRPFGTPRGSGWGLRPRIEAQLHLAPEPFAALVEDGGQCPPVAADLLDRFGWVAGRLVLECPQTIYGRGGEKAGPEN